MVKLRSSYIHKKVYNPGEFVDVLIEGTWKIGIVEKIAMFENFKGIPYQVLLTNENVSRVFSEKQMRPSETFSLSQEVVRDLEVDMTDPTEEQEKETRKVEEFPKLPREDPWSSQDFVKKKTSPKPKRFLAVSESEIDKLQDQSKSKNTHKQTGWGVRTLRGL